MRLGPGGLADVEGAAVLAAEGGSDPVLALEDAAQGGPACGLTEPGEASADDLYELVGEDGDEQVVHVAGDASLPADGRKGTTAQARTSGERNTDSLIGEKGVPGRRPAGL